MSYGSPVDYDMDSFLNLDQEFYSPSDAFTPHTSFSSSSVLSSTSEHREGGNAFPGPSHEYGRFKQQTGLPTGGVANLAAIDEMDTYIQPQTNSQSGLFDMDFESSSRSISAYMFQDNANPSGFVNPSAIQTQRVRHYPGVHTQAAEQAKAHSAAERKRQQEQGHQMMRQRQMSQQHLAAPAHTERHRSSSSSRASSDPAVEERISRLLDQMRHNSNASASEAEAAAQNFDAESSRMSKMKKDEDDMDEDERLLASEEGKKLSSKERRQLRNKVSARAFRSRRKEYIGQLEGEVAGKAQENVELRTQIRQLQAQNQQLTQLTQTLLRHPAFSSFLEDMSNDPTIIAPIEEQNKSINDTESEQNNQQSKPIKQESESQQHQHHQHELEVHMASLPPTRLDFSMLNLGGSHWGSNHVGSHYRQSQVYAVTDLPQGPSVEELKPSDSFCKTSPSPTSLQARLPWYHFSNDFSTNTKDQ